MPEPSHVTATDRIAAKILSADKLGTTKILLDLEDVREVMTQLNECRQRRAYEKYVDSKHLITEDKLLPIIERKVE